MKWSPEVTGSIQDERERAAKLHNLSERFIYSDDDDLFNSCKFSDMLDIFLAAENLNAKRRLTGSEMNELHLLIEKRYGQDFTYDIEKMPTPDMVAIFPVPPMIPGMDPTRNTPENYDYPAYDKWYTQKLAEIKRND